MKTTRLAEMEKRLVCFRERGYRRERRADIRKCHGRGGGGLLYRGKEMRPKVSGKSPQEKKKEKIPRGGHRQKGHGRTIKGNLILTKKPRKKDASC